MHSISKRNLLRNGPGAPCLLTCNVRILTHLVTILALLRPLGFVAAAAGALAAVAEGGCAASTSMPAVPSCSCEDWQSKHIDGHPNAGHAIHKPLFTAVQAVCSDLMHTAGVAHRRRRLVAG